MYQIGEDVLGNLGDDVLGNGLRTSFEIKDGVVENTLPTKGLGLYCSGSSIEVGRLKIFRGVLLPDGSLMFWISFEQIDSFKAGDLNGRGALRVRAFLKIRLRFIELIVLSRSILSWISVSSLDFMKELPYTVGFLKYPC